MKTEFKSSFLRDLKAIKDQNTLNRIREVIEIIERVESSQSIENLKKLQGTGDYYRIRIGDSRVGLVTENENIIFVRCLNRRDMCKFFR